jgi:hypothetical protein
VDKYDKYDKIYKSKCKIGSTSKSEISVPDNRDMREDIAKEKGDWEAGMKASSTSWLLRTWRWMMATDP